MCRFGTHRGVSHGAHADVRRHNRRRRDPGEMASKVAGQFAHMKNLAADFVRAKPNRACPRRRAFRPIADRIPSSRQPSSVSPAQAYRPPDALSPPPRSQTVFELAKQLPEYGVGARFARTRWEHRGAPDSYWTVSRMKPKPSGRAGRAWGTLTWKGEAKEGVRRIPGSMKAGIWRVLEEPKTMSGPKLSKPEPSEEAAEGQ